MKKYLGIILLLVAVLSCRQPSAALRNGDLVFVGLPMDYSLEADSMDAAISASTGKDSLNIIHVAIAEVRGDSTWIIDATIKRGVDRHPLDTFLTDFTPWSAPKPTVAEAMTNVSSRTTRNFTARNLFN